jgi:hypothetical protein
MLMQTLHLLYDEDILPEEAILDWHKNPSLYDAGTELRILVSSIILTNVWFKTCAMSINPN